MQSEQQQRDRYTEIARILTRVGWLQDWLLQRARARAVDVLKSAGATYVLDACCGTGTLSNDLHRAGMQVVGVDLSPSMLSLARKKAPQVRFIEADLSHVELERRVDGAVVSLAIHEMPEQTRVLVWQALRRLTRPGGTLVVIDYATPEAPRLLSRIAEKVISTDERYVGHLDPGHFENFEDFQAHGGACGWLTYHGETVVSDARFLFDNLSVAVVRA